MDEFFQDLREIQKKERNLSSLSPVGEDFYQQISSYFNKLMERIDNNPFSFESYLLRDAQRIVVEICERREYKITNSAVMNAQRSHHLFKNSKRDSRPKVPINSTPEEQKLYMELYSSLTAYREEMRSPLLSYSHKKEIKSSSFSPSRSSYSVDNEGSLDKDNVSESIVSGNESPLSKEIGKKPTSRSPPLDEIPPDIQDEIYRQFGREPSKQDSKHSSTGSAVETAIDSSPKARGSENGNNVPGDFETVSGQKTVHLEDEPVLDNAKDTGSKISTEVLMILEELPSIMGVDRKVYGPFHPGDIITMPEPNARILIKNQKGKSIQRYK